MNNNYNANIYLDPIDLNKIENDIEEITNDIQEQVFNNTQSPLRTIQVGDNLSGKTLYLSFPRNTYEDIDNSTENIIIKTNNNTSIGYFNYSNRRNVHVAYKSVWYLLYAKVNTSSNPYLNLVRCKLPYDFGTVNEIDSNDILYQFIKIYDDETIIPDYVKSTHNVNDILTMRKIDNIEQGIKNIGEYYYKPIGFIGDKEWLGTGNLGNFKNYAVGMKNISYQDLNRWTNNLKLINFDNINAMTIWNSSVSEIIWNASNQTEWEEF